MDRLNAPCFWLGSAHQASGVNRFAKIQPNATVQADSVNVLIALPWDGNSADSPFLAFKLSPARVDPFSGVGDILSQAAPAARPKMSSGRRWPPSQIANLPGAEGGHAGCGYPPRLETPFARQRNAPGRTASGWRRLAFALARINPATRISSSKCVVWSYFFVPWLRGRVG